MPRSTDSGQQVDDRSGHHQSTARELASMANSGKWRTQGGGRGAVDSQARNTQILNVFLMF